jgi:phosphoribosylanthranilate isomerase
MTKIKICGITTSQAVQELNANQVDFAGFIAYEKSSRFITSEQYRQLTTQLKTQSVLVVVNATNELIKEYVSAFRPDFLQLHGDESAEDAAQIKAKYNIKIIKAIAANDEIHNNIKAFEQVADMLLFDTQAQNGAFGGTGKSFDWDILQHIHTQKPWFLSGGIGAENIAQAMQHSDFIDVSSSLETIKGVKDIAKIKYFMDIVREHNKSKI